MKLLSAIPALLLLIGTAAAAQPAVSTDTARKITVTRSGSQAPTAGPAEYFTGSVRVDPLFQAGPSDTSAAFVTFEPRARSAWHAHPLGQILVVTAGVGRVQQWGEPIQEMRAGDVVWIPPHQKHWHGASADSAMTHIAITSAVAGKNADWMEKVSEEQYMPHQPKSAGVSVTSTRTDVSAVAPALDRFTQETLSDVWKRPGLSPRDRSLVTLAVLIARNQTTDQCAYRTGQFAQLPAHLNRAMDNGLSNAEVSEVLTHLLFYAGRPNVFTAVPIAKDVFDKRAH